MDASATICPIIVQPLCSGQLLRRLLLACVVLTAYSGLFVRAAEISAPATLVVTGTPGMPNCTLITIVAEGSDVVLVQSRWAASPSRSLSEYRFSAADAGIVVEHPNTVWLAEGRASIPFCVFGESAGVHAGVVLSRLSQSAGGVGTWITVNLSSEGSGGQADTVPERLRREQSKGAGTAVFALLVGTTSLLACFVMLLALRWNKPLMENSDDYITQNQNSHRRILKKDCYNHKVLAFYRGF